jgi:hypothetical protein
MVRRRSGESRYIHGVVHHIEGFGIQMSSTRPQFLTCSHVHVFAYSAILAAVVFNLTMPNAAVQPRHSNFAVQAIQPVKPSAILCKTHLAAS